MESNPLKVAIQPINIAWITAGGKRVEGTAIGKKQSRANPIMTLYLCYFGGGPEDAVWISEANLEF